MSYTAITSEGVVKLESRSISLLGHLTINSGAIRDMTDAWSSIHPVVAIKYRKLKCPNVSSTHLVPSALNAERLDGLT